MAAATAAGLVVPASRQWADTVGRLSLQWNDERMRWAGAVISRAVMAVQ